MLIDEIRTKLKDNKELLAEAKKELASGTSEEPDEHWRDIIKETSYAIEELEYLLEVADKEARQKS